MIDLKKKASDLSLIFSWRSFSIKDRLTVYVQNLTIKAEKYLHFIYFAWKVSMIFSLSKNTYYDAYIFSPIRTLEALQFVRDLVDVKCYTGREKTKEKTVAKTRNELFLECVEDNFTPAKHFIDIH